MNSKQLFFNFIEDALNLPHGSVVGLQSSFGEFGSDQIVFYGPRRNSLCVPVTLLMESREIARRVVAEKIEASEARWRKAS